MGSFHGSIFKPIVWRDKGEVECLSRKPPTAAHLAKADFLKSNSKISKYFHDHHVCQPKLVYELFEDVLLALAPAHVGEEHAEDGDGEDRLVDRHLRHNCPEWISIYH